MNQNSKAHNPFDSSAREILSLVTPDTLNTGGFKLKKPVYFVVDPTESFGSRFLASQLGSGVAQDERNKAKANGVRHLFTMAMELEEAVKAIEPLANGAGRSLRKQWQPDRALVFTLACGEVLLGECALPSRDSYAA